MSRVHKICTPFVHGLTGAKSPQRSSSEEAAVRERVDNTRVTVLRGDLLRRAGLSSHPRAAFEIVKLWENGRTLRCKFLDGVAEVKEKVANIAKEWEEHANLKLDFVASGAAQIHISFAEKDFSWSAVGTDALTARTGEPTMNFGWLEPTTALREYQRVVRHEFGHALGMIHEHQNPAAQGQIPWDKPKVYAYYAQQGWSKADVDFNIFQVYSEESTNHSRFDPSSIMEYAVPDSLTVGSFSIGWNTEFSDLDIDYMRRQYPRSRPALTELTIGGPRVEANLDGAGEVDTFHFDVETAATYIMTTQGPTDTVLTLHGPNDPGAVLAWDDDRGAGLNARIVRKLQPGSYWLTVRHKDAAATGTYDIGIKKRA
jgi:astacin (peptidase family M12A)